MRIDDFDTEADMVKAFCEWVKARQPGWTIYHETAGWDLLLVQDITGIQVGVEAKLILNAKVISQAVGECNYVWSDSSGPDYRAVLVPEKRCQNFMRPICDRLGLTIISMHGTKWRGDLIQWHAHPSNLPDESHEFRNDWFSWLPAERCKLPEYVPDVLGGKPSPVCLTPWKVKAIKLLIMLERFGAVTRKDMKALKISPTRWTAYYYGYLSPGDCGYVRNENTPDLRAQHPENWAQIEADFDEWIKDIIPIPSDLAKRVALKQDGEA